MMLQNEEAENDGDGSENSDAESTSAENPESQAGETDNGTSVAGDGAEENANAMVDETGEIDVSPRSIMETIDNIVDAVVDRLPLIVIGVVVALAFWGLAALARSIIRKSTENRESANLGLVLGRLAYGVLITLGLLLAIMTIVPSVSPADLLATLGVGGVAIGFAFKDILQNFMAGILILIREPFAIGDQIVSNEFEGTVQSIDTRSTVIKTYHGKKVVIPNNQIYTNPVVVNTSYGATRSELLVGVGYGENLDEAIEQVLNVLRSTDGVEQSPEPDVVVDELAGSTVNLKARWWTQPDRATVVGVSSRVATGVKQALDEAGIDMPYPTRAILFQDITESDANDDSLETVPRRRVAR